MLLAKIITDEEYNRIQSAKAEQSKQRTKDLKEFYISELYARDGYVVDKDGKKLQMSEVLPNETTKL